MKLIPRRTQFILLLILAALIFGGGVQYARLGAGGIEIANTGLPVQGEPASESVSVSGQAGDGQTPPIYVHVAGAVARPGVYELAESARVMEAVQKAGPLADAELERINLAARLRDGQQVVVPRQGETAEVQLSSGAAATEDSRLVNLNAASLEELATLPGIGPVLAQRIIDYRTRQQLFRSVDDLQNVSGIGASRMEQLRPLVTVD